MTATLLDKWRELAKREVAAARGNKVYEVTFDQKKNNRPDPEIRAWVLKSLAKQRYTTKQLRARANITNERMYNILADLEASGLVKQRRVVIDAHSQSQWSLK